MEFTTLGRTGLKVSICGMGCGGPSRVGQRYGNSIKASVDVVRHSLDAGINLIDTAEVYQTEEIVGKAIQGYDRELLVISTKKSTWGRITGKDVEKSLERSLKLLGTDYIDIYHLHAPIFNEYEYLVKEIVPKLLEMKREGKIRFLGITERFNQDPQHLMLTRALQDDCWDVIMVGFNILNQSARDRIFPKTIDKKIGVLIMFAVRLALSKSERLIQVISELIEQKKIDPSNIDMDNPLGFLIHDDVESIMDAAYRFCNYEPGADVILSGTGNIDHLKANLRSFSKPPLSRKDVERLKKIFKNVDSVSGQ